MDSKKLGPTDEVNQRLNIRLMSVKVFRNLIRVDKNNKANPEGIRKSSICINRAVSKVRERRRVSMVFLEQERETKRRRCLKAMEKKKKRPFIITIKQAWKYSTRKIEIPNDIFEEILMKLAVESLIKFQTLSKHSKSLIRSSGFKKGYMSYHQTKDPKLFFISDNIVNRPRKPLFIKTMTLEKGEAASLEHTRPLKFKDFKWEFLEVSESCDGLVCIHDATVPIKVMNPASGMSITLPLAKIQQLLIDHPHPSLKLGPAAEQGPVQFRAFIRFGFGKDDVTGNYKLVCLYNQYPATSATTSSTVCEVLDFKERKWRLVNTTTLDHHHVLNGQRPVFANGSFYWLTGDEEGYPTPQTNLIVFDIHTEMFQFLPTPSFISPHVYGDKIGVCNLDGRLCISHLNEDCKQEFWWRTSDKAKWEKIFSVDLNSTSAWFGGITSEPLTPLAISRETNKVILSLSYRENLVAFDLRPHSPVYHLYYSGYYGVAVPYFPSLLFSP